MKMLSIDINEKNFNNPKTVLKNLDDKADQEYNDLLKKLYKKYDQIDKRVIQNIFDYGYDSACSYYENQQGYIKNIHILKKIYKYSLSDQNE